MFSEDIENNKWGLNLLGRHRKDLVTIFEVLQSGMKIIWAAYSRHILA